MLPPDQRLLEEDFTSAEFRAGADKGRWGRLEPLQVPANLAWPHFVLWIAAVPREKAPDRYYFLLDGTGYRVRSPTGSLWDPTTQSALETAKRPKGRADSRFAKVFRTDWNSGTAFYHPYDRVASESHPKWPGEQPHLVWTAEHTIVDFVEEFHGLLHSSDYAGA